MQSIKFNKKINTVILCAGIITAVLVLFQNCSPQKSAADITSQGVVDNAKIQLENENGIFTSKESCTYKYIVTKAVDRNGIDHSVVPDNRYAACDEAHLNYAAPSAQFLPNGQVDERSYTFRCSVYPAGCLDRNTNKPYVSPAIKISLDSNSVSKSVFPGGSYFAFKVDNVGIESYGCFDIVGVTNDCLNGRLTPAGVGRNTTFFINAATEYFLKSATAQSSAGCLNGSCSGTVYAGKSWIGKYKFYWIDSFTKKTSAPYEFEIANVTASAPQPAVPVRCGYNWNSKVFVVGPAGPDGNPTCNASNVGAVAYMASHGYKFTCEPYPVGCVK